MTDRTLTSDPVAPTTEAGRRLVAEFGVGQFGRLERHAVAIEAEARQQARAAFAAQVRAALPRAVNFRVPLALPVKDPTWDAIATDLLALLAASPEPASPEAPGSGLREALDILERADGIGPDNSPQFWDGWHAAIAAVRVAVAVPPVLTAQRRTRDEPLPDV